MMLYARLLSTAAMFAVLMHAAIANDTLEFWKRLVCAMFGALVLHELLELVARWEIAQKKRER